MRLDGWNNLCHILIDQPAILDFALCDDINGFDYPPCAFALYLAAQLQFDERLFRLSDHIASFIVNVNHSGVRTAAKLCVTNCIADCVWPGIPHWTERKRITDYIDAAFIGS